MGAIARRGTAANLVWPAARRLGKDAAATKAKLDDLQGKHELVAVIQCGISDVAEATSLGAHPE